MKAAGKHRAKKIVLYLLLGLYKLTFGLFIRIKYKVSYENIKCIPKKGPFIIVGNHSNNYDGLFLQCFCPRIIRFVVTDAVFRKKALGKLLCFAGYIPKRKHYSDAGTIRKIIKTASNGDIVGIFPEGMRNWDGATASLYRATFRVIQYLKVPVVAACIKGGYLSWPRWADTKRRGKIQVEFTKLFDTGMPASLEEVESAITKALCHDDGKWQQKMRIPFKGRALCKGFERLLYVCPKCGAFGTIDSSDKRIWCRVCDASFSLDVYGFFHDADGSPPVKTVYELNKWQQEKLYEYFSAADKNELLLTDAGAVLSAANNTNAGYEPVEQGNIELYANSLNIGGKKFDIDKISGVSVYFKSHLDFSYGGTDYRIGFNDKRISAYKWSCAVSLLKRNNTKELKK